MLEVVDRAKSTNTNNGVALERMDGDMGSYSEAGNIPTDKRTKVSSLSAYIIFLND